MAARRVIAMAQISRAIGDMNTLEKGAADQMIG